MAVTIFFWIVFPTINIAQFYLLMMMGGASVFSPYPEHVEQSLIIGDIMIAISAFLFILVIVFFAVERVVIIIKSIMSKKKGLGAES